MRVGLVSLDQEWEDKAENLTRCRALARRAAALEAQLIVFPEMTLTGFTMSVASVAEHPADSSTIRAFSALARELRVALAFGVVLHGAERPANSMIVVAPDGAELARYAKLHPFSLAHENAHYEAGSSLATAIVHDVACGLSICYDLRFPELFTALAATCDAILVIASWPQARIGHWNALLVARAIDCQCYVVAVNRTGTDGNGIHFPRSSQVIDPRGERLVPDAVDGDVELFTIDARKVAAYRRAFPTLRDRRPVLYEELRASAAART
jgi:predicted amidohydrolase